MKNTFGSRIFIGVHHANWKGNRPKQIGFFLATTATVAVIVASVRAR